MKKNKLYTVNSWNRPAFMPKNIFLPGGNMVIGDQSSFFQHQGNGLYGDSYGENGRRYMTPVQGISPTSSLNSSLMSRASGFNPQIKSANTGQPNEVTIKPSTMQAVGTGLSAIGDIPTGDKRGLWDTLDPVYHIAGGRESGVGNTMSDAGVGLTKAGLQSGNPWMAVAGAGLKVVGGLTNAAFGIKTDKTKVENAEKSIDQNQNYIFNGGLDDVPDIAAVTDTNAYSGGWFSGGKARRKNEELRNRMVDARDWAVRSQENGIDNILNDQINEGLANYSAFGGPINTGDMGAIDYGFMSDYLTQKKRETDMKNKMAGLSPMPAFMPNNFAIGGDLQTNGGDWSTGLTHINAGKSHEENPNDGVQLGTDNEGTPNLVEEDETIWNDYVFSARIPIDQTTKEMFHIGKKREMTYADLSKKLENEIAERPNDPVSRAGFEKQMAMLEEQQERQKREMEAERAKAAFEALSPEEQTALMQQKAQQEQMAQEQAVQEQAMAGQQSAIEENMGNYGGISPNPMMADGSQPNLGEEPQMNACGGKINKFEGGGVLKFLRQLGYKSAKDAEKAGWKPSDFGDFNDWNSITEDSAFGDDFDITRYTDRITSPEMKAAISMGYRPGTKRISRRWYEPFGGNNVGWTESYSKDALNAQEFKEYADRYKNTLGWALNNGIIKAPEEGKTISTQEVVEAMKQAPDWQNTDKWLRADRNNLAKYIGDARSMTGDNDVKFRDKWSKFGDFTQNEDGTWNYALRNNLTSDEGKAFEDLFWKGRGDSKIGVMYNSFTDPNENTGNYLIDDDGNVTRLWDTSGYEKVGNPWDWSDEDSLTNNSATFYRAKPDSPRHWAEWPRYAGLFGPAVGLGMQALGIGRPNTGLIDAALEGSGDVSLARWKPLGNYLTYRPLDIWYEQNALNAQSRATDRALMNQTSPSRMAGLLSNGYNSQLASGNLFRQAQEYNDNLRKQVEDFNRGTNQFNSEQFGATSRFNADARNRARQSNTQLRLQAAAQKADMDAGWYNGIYGNLSGLFKGLSDLGTENYRMNRIFDMAADGLFGVLGSSYTGKRVVKSKKGKQS